MRTIDAVRSHVGVPVAQLARMTDTTEGEVVHDLRRLEAAGMVESYKVGRTEYWMEARDEDEDGGYPDDGSSSGNPRYDHDAWVDLQMEMAANR